MEVRGEGRGGGEGVGEVGDHVVRNLDARLTERKRFRAVGEDAAVPW